MLPGEDRISVLNQRFKSLIQNAVYRGACLCSFFFLGRALADFENQHCACACSLTNQIGARAAAACMGRPGLHSTWENCTGHAPGRARAFPLEPERRLDDVTLNAYRNAVAFMLPQNQRFESAFLSR